MGLVQTIKDIGGGFSRKFWGGSLPPPYFGLALTAGEVFGTAGVNGITFLYTTDPSRHSVVFSAIRLLSDTITSTEFQLGATFGSRKDEPSPDDAVAMALNYPELLSKSEMIYGIVEGLIANGNAYIIPESPSRLRLVDWRNMQPPRPGRLFYEERKPLTGVIVPWQLDQVIHLRYRRAPDGINGIGPLNGSALADMSTDIQAQQYSDTMLRNMGVAGIIGSPDFSGGERRTIDPYAADAIRETIDEQMSGENRGKAMFFRSPISWFEPRGASGRLDVRSLRIIPEERLLGAVGVAASLLHMGSGVDQSAVGATMDNVERRFLTNTVRPLADKIAQQLTQQLLPMYSKAKDSRQRYFLVVDMSKLTNLAALEREVAEQRMTTAVAGYQAGIIGLVEARKAADYEEPVPDDIKVEEPKDDGKVASSE